MVKFKWHEAFDSRFVKLQRRRHDGQFGFHSGNIQRRLASRTEQMTGIAVGSKNWRDSMVAV